MVVFIVGTSAELIKVQPVAQRLLDRGAPVQFWATYQHTDSLDRMFSSYGFPQPSFVFARGARGKPIQRPTQMIGWLARCIRMLFTHRRELRKRLGERPLIIVHGDTVTTVFGAIAARVLGATAAHVEAGLRSGRLFRPFPEEIDRRLTGRIAHIHYVPNAVAADNLAGKDVVNTFRNTAVDGVLDSLASAPAANSGERYGIALLHRFELISQPSFVDATVRTIADNATIPVYVITDAFSGGPVEAAIARVNSPLLRPIPKRPYRDFVQFMRDAEFLVTDSGGLQQESAVLGVPTLLHRQVTESPDGVGANVVLSGWDLDAVASFLQNPERYRSAPDVPESRPSDIIVTDLIRRGFVGNSDSTHRGNE
ncbi:MAG TPA: UDP-N-acetylglucosamine 2-epimerase [Microbacteriaceae bacterium]|nr:UDP-N-acetylglucosamine 2-epimerase [Microbacteriaceae bacterium]